MTIEAPANLLAPENERLFNELNPAEQLALICREKTDKEHLLAGAETDIAARAAALKKAAANVLNPLKSEIEALEDRARAIISPNRKILLGSKQTLELCGQVIAYRKRPVVEIDDEARALEELSDMADDEAADAADRISAKACLREGKVTLNKEFMREASKKCGAWLASFGVRVVREEKLSINLQGEGES